MKDKNTQTKGKIAELKVELKAVEKGFIVSKPTQEARYDLILDDGIRLYKAQVKYANGKCSNSKGAICVTFRMIHKNHSLVYSRDEVDLILVYLPVVEKIICLKPEYFHNKIGIYIRYEPSKNKGAKIHWYEDFLW